MPSALVPVDRLYGDAEDQQDLLLAATLWEKQITNLALQQTAGWCFSEDLFASLGIRDVLENWRSRRHAVQI